MSNPSSASAVSGFTFKSIGKPPSLLSRIRDADSTLVSYPPAETSPSPPPGSAAPASPVVSQPAGKRSLLGRLEGVPSAAPTTPARPDIVANRTNSAAVVQDIFNIPLITPTSNLPANPTQTSNPVMSSFCLTIPPEPTAPSTFTSPVSTSAASNPTASRPSSTSIPPVDLHALALTATTADLYRRISELSTERMELNEASLARQRVLDAQREYLRRHEETRSAAVREKEQMDKLVDAVLDALQKTEKARERQEKRWAEDNLQLEKLLKAKAQDEEEEKRRKDEEARIQAQQEADAAAARKTQEELAERAARARKEAEEAKAREKAAAEKAARERREAEEAQAREKAAADKAAAEKAAAEKAAAEKAAAEKAAAEKAAAEKAAAEKAAAEKAAAEKAAAEKAAAEKAARERREVEEAKAREKEAAERAARARQEAEAAKARENEAAAARAKAAEEEAKAKERDMAEKIRQEREEKERLERLEAQARAKAEVARARAEKLEQDRMRAEVMAKTQAATAERVKKQAEERAKLPVAGASLDAAKSSNTATPIKVEKEQAIARPPSAASTTSQRPKAPQPVITTSKAAAPPRLDVPLPSPAPTPALSRGSQHPLAAPGLIPHVSRPPTPAQQRVLANTSNGLQQSLPQTQPPTHIPTIFQHPEDTVDVKPSLDTLQYPTTSASLRPTQTTDNIKTSPSMSSRKIQRSLWPPVSTPPTSTVSSQPTSSGPAHQPQIATPGIARVQSRDSSSQNGTARASKPTDSTPAYGVKPEPVEVPLPPQGTQKQTPQRVQQQQTSSANTKTTISAAPAVPPTRAPPIPRSTAVAQAPLAPVASLPPPASLPPKPSLPPPPVTTRPQSTAAPVKAPIPATQNFNARNGDRSGRPPAPVGTNSTRNTIATRSDPVAPPNNSSTRAAPSNQPHVAQPHWQEHDDDPWVTDPRGRGEMDYHWEQYPSPDRRADHWSPIRDHPPTRQSFPAHPSHYQPLSPPPRKRMHDSYPDDTPYKRQRFNERSRSPPPRRAYNAPDRAHTPPSPRYRSPLRDLPPRRTPSPPRYTPEPPVSPYASSVGSRRSYDWGPGPSAPHDRSYSPQQPRSRQLPARPPPPPPPVDRSMPDYKQQRPPSSGMQTVPSTSQPQAESASVWRRAVPMPIQVPVRDVHPDLLSRIDPGEGSTNRGRRGRGNGRGRGRGGANAARGGRGGSSRPLADRFQDGHRDLQSRITG